MTQFKQLLLALCLIVSGEQAYADEVANIAVASNFSQPMKELLAAFEKEHSGKLRASYASSGKLFAQIQHGAPFHILLSADEKVPQALIAKDLAVATSRFTYAVGSLVLWAPNSDATQSVKQRLLMGEFETLALANPKHAPYGRAAVQTLHALNLATKVKGKRVTGDNIAQTYHFISSGNADIGFVARSQLTNSEFATDHQSWFVPTDYHVDIKQDAVLLRRGENNKLARKFMLYMQSTAALEIIRKYGYDVTARRRGN